MTVVADPNWTSGWIANPLDKSSVSEPVPVRLISGITLTSGRLIYRSMTDPLTENVLNAAVSGVGADFICIMSSVGSALAVVAANVLDDRYYYVPVTFPVAVVRGRVCTITAAFRVPKPKPDPDEEEEGGGGGSSNDDPPRCPEDRGQPLPVYVIGPFNWTSGTDIRQVRDARREAISVYRYPDVLTLCRACRAANERAIQPRRRLERLRTGATSDEEIDEYPYRITREGGAFAFLRKTNARQNGSEGSQFRNFLRSWSVKEGCKFVVVVQ